MLIHKIASSLAKRLACYIEWQNKEGLLTYGFELIIGESLKFATLLFLSTVYSLLHYTLLILLAALPFRLVSGGGHCKTYFRCFVTTVSVYMFLSFLARNLYLNLNTPLPLLLVPLLAVVSLVIVKIWVPGENASRPFTPSEAIKFRRLSNMFILSWAVTCLIVNGVWPGEFKVFFITTGLGIFWQSFFVTPLGYQLLNGIEQFFEILQIKGGEKNA